LRLDVEHDADAQFASTFIRYYLDSLDHADLNPAEFHRGAGAQAAHGAIREHFIDHLLGVPGRHYLSMTLEQLETGIRRTWQNLFILQARRFKGNASSASAASDSIWTSALGSERDVQSAAPPEAAGGTHQLFIRRIDEDRDLHLLEVADQITAQHFPDLHIPKIDR